MLRSHMMGDNRVGVTDATESMIYVTTVAQMPLLALPRHPNGGSEVRQTAQVGRTKAEVPGMDADTQRIDRARRHRLRQRKAIRTL